MDFKYELCKLYLTITRFIISFRQIGRHHLGTHVLFRGIECVIVDLNSYDRFGQIFTLNRVRNPKMIVYPMPIKARETELTKVMTFNNIWHDATYWWKWYKQNWLSLDTRAMARNQTLSSIKVLGRNRALGRK